MSLKTKESQANVIPSFKANPARSMKSSPVPMALQTHHCLKCFIVKRLWMVSVNMYDFMGLIDICPCNTLHAIKPYVSCKH